jgi:hypothetical protein
MGFVEAQKISEIAPRPMVAERNVFLSVAKKAEEIGRTVVAERVDSNPR